MKYHLLALRSSLLGSCFLGSCFLGSSLLGSCLLGSCLLGSSFLGSSLLGSSLLLALGKHEVDEIFLFGMLGVTSIFVALSLADCPKVF